MRRLLLVFLLPALLSGCSTVSGWFSSAPKPLPPAPLVSFKPSAELVRAFSVDAGSPGFHRLQPAVAHEVLYVAGESGRVEAYGVLDSKRLWQSDIRAGIVAGVGAGGELVVVGAAQAGVVALHAANGTQAWSTTLTSDVTGPPLVADGVVLVRTNDGSIYGLAAKDGKQQWVYTRQLPSLMLQGSGGMSVKDGVLYAGYPGGRLVALSVANGAQLWDATVAVPRGATELERLTDVVGPPAVNASQVCAVAYQGRVACFDRASGNLLWARDTSSETGLAMDGANVYVADTADSVTAYAADSGRIVWKQAALARRGVSAPLPYAATVIVGDSEGYVHVLSAQDGSFLARRQAPGGAVIGRPFDIGPGIAVETAKGEVTAFRLK